MSKSFSKTFEVRWSDLDANRHLANVSFVNYTMETRLSFLRENGITHQFFAKHNMGPVILKEEYTYVKEVMPDSNIHVSLKLHGHSSDLRFLQFAHQIKNENDKPCAFAKVTFCWMDLAARKIIVPNQELVALMDQMEKSHGFRILEKRDVISNIRGLM